MLIFKGGEETMPGFDRTGPLGRGSLSGRGLGPCGWSLRRFFGWDRPWTKGEQQESLEEYKKALQEELKEVESLLKKSS